MRDPRLVAGGPSHSPTKKIIRRIIMETDTVPRHTESPDRPAGFTYGFTDIEGVRYQGFVSFEWLLSPPLGWKKLTFARIHSEIPEGIEVHAID
jgi:hypothetical protein